MKMIKTRLALYIMLACLLLASAIGTAYAKYASTPLTDEFQVYVTAGTIDDFGISGGESGLVVIPGAYLKLTQNPTVSLDKTSEDCFVFIEIHKTQTIADIMTFTPDSTTWTQLKDSNGNDIVGVYYHQSTKNDNVEAKDKREHKVFNDAALDQSIWVLPSATKAQIQTINAGGTPDKITFTAYAVQMTPGVMDAATAWAKLKP